MSLKFVNRSAELHELDAHARSGGLLVVFGRRRVGKTRLLRQWLSGHEGLYSQAIEASKEQQLAQIVADIRVGLNTTLEPRTMQELLEVLDLQPQRFVLCLDELPYLVASDPSLPSVLQRWLDHRRHARNCVVLSGSSTRMMNDLFLNRSAPLFGRARKILEVAPMGYGAFCKACKLNPVAPQSFTKFSLVGGVPKYWELVAAKQSPVDLANELFFGFSPALEFEPSRLLKDEGIAGLTAPSLLEAIGRGAHKASEIAARLSTPQTSLSRLFQVLLDARLIEREIPFGESMRSTKRALYRLIDPTLRFWFSVYSPHRTRWSAYTTGEKQKLLDDHASTVFEQVLRARWPSSSRYWQADVELDLVRLEGKTLIVSEVKWATHTPAQRKGLLVNLEARFAQSALATHHEKVEFELLDMGQLRQLV